jgi:nitrogen-specific signal transduction histidine kinase
MRAEDFLNAYEVVPEPMIIVSAPGKLIGANAGARALLKKSGNELQDVSLFDLVTDSREKVQRLLALAQRSRQFLPGSITLRIADASLECRTEAACLVTVIRLACLFVFLQRQRR